MHRQCCQNTSIIPQLLIISAKYFYRLKLLTQGRTGGNGNSSYSSSLKDSSHALQGFLHSEGVWFSELLSGFAAHGLLIGYAVKPHID